MKQSVITFLTMAILISIACASLAPTGDSEITPGAPPTSTIPLIPPDSTESASLPATLTPQPTFTSTPLAIDLTPTFVVPSTETASLTPTASITPFFIHGAGNLDAWCLPWNHQSERGRVTQVFDGTTIEVDIGGNPVLVRYIGIGMPEAEPGSEGWGQVVARNRALVENQDVLLIQDLITRDTQDYLLRYVIAGSVFVNREMIESGYGLALSMPPNTSCDGVFREAERLAREAGRGIWSPFPTLQPTRALPTPTFTVSRVGGIKINFIYYRGTPWEEPDEFAEITNTGFETVQLEGWELRNLEGHRYVFPPYLIRPGQFCRIYTNQYHPGTCGLSFNRPSPVWDNISDCAFLKDWQGNLIDELCY